MLMNATTLTPGTLTLRQLRRIYEMHHELKLSSASVSDMRAARHEVETVAFGDRAVYGINTGFGSLATTQIPHHHLRELQEKLIVSHAAGVGRYLDAATSRLILALKINCLARGHSGIRPMLVERLLALYNAELYPCMHERGSVGASGDLAPLADLAAVLLGVGDVHANGSIIPAADALDHVSLAPLEFEAKEGLALLNGTQVSTALSLRGLFAAENLLAAGIVSGCLSVEAANGSHVPFDARIHAARGQLGQIKTASWCRALLAVGEINESHHDCPRVQDPYSLRCQPQVMGACLDQIENVARILEIEANAVTDNPLIFADDHEIVSGGNFHAEPVAIAADVLAVCIAEIGAISERRIAMLIDRGFSGLPPFLVDDSGVNSGFMIAHVTASALASENKSLAHPASVDTLPTSANQEDHVSMATFAGLRLEQMCSNVANIIGIELLAAAQGLDFHRPLVASAKLQDAVSVIRGLVPFYEADRLFHPDIDKMAGCVADGRFNRFLPESALPSF